MIFEIVLLKERWRIEPGKYRYVRIDFSDMKYVEYGDMSTISGLPFMDRNVIMLTDGWKFYLRKRPCTFESPYWVKI
jgi:hypothetical protein